MCGCSTVDHDVHSVCCAAACGICLVVIAIADHGDDMDWCHVIVAIGWDWRKCQWLLSLLLSRVVLTVPSVVIVVVVPLCSCILNVRAFSLSNIVNCHSAVFGKMSCSSTSVACICCLSSFVLSFVVVSFAESFVSFVASSKWIAKANRIVVVVVESFCSLLSFSFVVDAVTVVAVAVVSSVAFAFVLSFSFPFVTVVLPFSFVDCVNVHGCLSSTKACCYTG